MPVVPETGSAPVNTRDHWLASTASTASPPRPGGWATWSLTSVTWKLLLAAVVATPSLTL